MRQWLQRLPEEWNVSEETIRFVRKHPKIEAMRQLTIFMASATILHSDILTVNFSCNNLEVHEYIKARMDFIGNGVHAAAWLRMHQGKQAETMYEIAVNDVLNRFLRYVVRRFCGREVTGKERALHSARRAWTEQDELEKALCFGFVEELTILDAMYPDIPYGKGGASCAEYTTAEYRHKELEILRRTEAILQSRLPNRKPEAAP